MIKCWLRGLRYSCRAMLVGNYTLIQGHEGQEQACGKIICNDCGKVMHDPEQYKEYEWCRDCDHCIVKSDDDAYICIECGGRNRRIPHHSLLRGILGKN